MAGFNIKVNFFVNDDEMKKIVAKHIEELSKRGHSLISSIVVKRKEFQDLTPPFLSAGRLTQILEKASSVKFSDTGEVFIEVNVQPQFDENIISGAETLSGANTIHLTQRDLIDINDLFNM